MIDNVYDEQVGFQTGLFHIIYNSDVLCSLYKTKGIQAVLEELAKHPEKHLEFESLKSNMEYDFRRCEGIEKLGLAPKDAKTTIESLCTKVSTRKEAQQAVDELVNKCSFDGQLLGRLHGIDYYEDEYDYGEMISLKHHLYSYIPDHLK